MFRKSARFGVWITLGVVAGAGIAFLFVGGALSSRMPAPFFVREKPSPFPPVSHSSFFYKPLSEPPAEGNYILVDLHAMSVSLYESGRLLSEFPIIRKAKPGSLWDSPSGEYRVCTKEEKHRSPISEIVFPESVAFFGNFYIHGRPEAPVGQEFTSGSIELSGTDAKNVFEFATIGMPVFVRGDGSLAGDSSYIQFRKSSPPSISAEAFLAKDLDSGHIFLAKEPDTPRSIASITKLMSALVSLKHIDQASTTEVSSNDLDIYGDSGNLVRGEKFRAKDLILPLLLASSNDAAYTLSHMVGTDQFVSFMNDTAQALNLTHTRFYDPSGLQLENVSTPEDLLALLTYIREKHPVILDTLREKKMALTTNKATHTWHNFNWKGDDTYFRGGKIGYIEAARKTMVALFRLPVSEFETRDIGVAVLASRDQARDVREIVRWIAHNFVYGALVKKEEPASIETAGPNRETYTLLFAGDIMMDRGTRRMIESQAGGDYFFPFAEIAGTIRDADIAFANLEGPASDKGEQKGSIYSFRMDPAVVKALYGAGFDVFSFANNHVGDYGREAFEDTLRRLYRAGIASVGAGWNREEALSPRVFLYNGVRIGFLGFSDVGPAWMKAGDTTSGIALADTKILTDVIRQARSRVDILIVSFHFGEEYQKHSNARQQALARTAIDAGASIVIGHHPHVVEEIERYNGGLIAYSLGDFVFDQTFSEDTQEGLLLRLTMKGRDIQKIEQMKVRPSSSSRLMIEE